MEKEKLRQFKRIELIASENFVCRAVMEALGSHLTNKYSAVVNCCRIYQQQLTTAEGNLVIYLYHCEVMNVRKTIFLDLIFCLRPVAFGGPTWLSTLHSPKAGPGNIPPQAGLCMSQRPSLEIKEPKAGDNNGLVNTLAS